MLVPPSCDAAVEGVEDRAAGTKAAAAKKWSTDRLPS